MRRTIQALLAERDELAGMLAELGYTQVAHSARQLAMTTLARYERARSIPEARAKQTAARLRAWGAL